MTDKEVLRKKFLAARKAIPPAERSTLDLRVAAAVRGLDCYRNAGCVALYASDGKEVSLHFRADGKRWFFPRYVPAKRLYELAEVKDPVRELVPARYGLLEPAPGLPGAEEDFVKENMLFIVPAVACTSSGVRLGRGGGFYDRLLSGKRREAVAVVYDCQLAETLPVEPHDLGMDFVVTPSRVYDCRTGKMRQE